jgi:hypothetical protein
MSIITYNHFMKKTPAQMLIEKAGGLKQASNALCLHPTVIHHWKTRSGLIPSKHISKILKVSIKKGWGITAEDLIG